MPLAETAALAYILAMRRCAARIQSKVIMLTRFLRRRRTRRHAWSKGLDFTHPRVSAALALFHRHV
ncbi:MAG: hypothetical protein J0H94_09710 [Rhizobiales bacterium]|nr:hypothetical protein [Hyphomicrobiales bacterium]